MNRIYDRRAIKCFERYLILINHNASDSENLFSRPLTGKRSDKKCLVTNKFAEKLFGQLELSKSYSSLSIRCTAITRAKESDLTTNAEFV